MGYGSVSERDTVLEVLNLLGLRLVDLHNIINEVLVLVVHLQEIEIPLAEANQLHLELVRFLKCEVNDHREGDDENRESEDGVRHGVSFQSKVFNIHQVILAKKRKA